MIAPGDIAPRRDTDSTIYVVVLSNSIHIAADTGRIIVCPYIPGPIPEGTMAMVVAVGEPEGVALPELVQWLPVTALDDPIGNIGAEALRQAVGLMTALIT
ncbi:toxin [Gordonia sp. HNM0687]|uniref:Toxin n=1 Tax=Gordonia mangrovi TaxID=2665643 RepID=A0A6L7GND9_9ACTN|nr:toxin [Gordonia mangrovi]MXP20235.1 toxin [Gordonia mangrovi]